MVQTTQTHSIAVEIACKTGPGQIFLTMYVTAVAICTNVDILPHRLGGNFLTLVNAITAATARRMHISRPRTPATNDTRTLPVAPSARKIPLSRHLSAIGSR